MSVSGGVLPRSSCGGFSWESRGSNMRHLDTFPDGC